MCAVFSKNEYELAFKNWMLDFGVRYVPADQARRAVVRGDSIKSFDYMLYPDDGPILIAELKGRKCSSSKRLVPSSFKNWVTLGDIQGLTRWERIFGSGYSGCFVFSYYLENPDIDTGGVESYEFEGRRYLFYVVGLDEYRRAMRIRSKSWQTVSVKSGRFVEISRSASELLLNLEDTIEALG